MTRFARFATVAAACAAFIATPALAHDHEGDKHGDKDKKAYKEKDKKDGANGTYGMAAPTGTIVEIAQGNEQFSTLVKALGEADLVAALGGEGPFTVFAPTDEAFAKLPEGTLEMLLKPENREQLAAVLKYHVVPGEIMAADAQKAAANDTEVKTLQGDALGLYAEDDKLMVSGATIIATDIDATNGVIHVIDTVLIPQEKADSGD